jgi:hypothetical protein
MKRFGIVLAMVVGCNAPVGTSGSTTLPKDSANQCAGICHDIGLGLESVVVMANNVGCVCSAMQAPQAAPPAETAPTGTPSAHAGGAAGGMAAIMLQQQAAAAQSQHHQ